MKFSERMGVNAPPLPLRLEELPPRLRTRLWNALVEEIQTWFESLRGRSCLPEQLWDEHLGHPIDVMPESTHSFQQHLSVIFFNQLQWFEVYDLLEFILRRTPTPRMAARVNQALEQELAAVRFINGGFVPVSDSTEIDEVEQALSRSPSEAKEHIAQALRSLAARPEPDTRTTVKEVMCAIESVAKQISGKPSATFSELPQTLIANGAHSQFVTAWKNMYSYTSDAGGVRHGLKEGDSPPTVAEAKLFVITGSAFVNYLVTTFL